MITRGVVCHRIVLTGVILLCGGGLALATPLAGTVAANLPDGLPAATEVSEASIIDGILYVDLTLPEGSDWALDPAGADTVSAGIGESFTHEATAGVVVRARIGESGSWQHLAHFEKHKPVPPATADGVVAPIPDLAVSQESARIFDNAGSGLRGPVVHGARQPTGALSGVTIFCSGGHGWTQEDNDWILQRPILLDMNEDYGNLDQLNYFVHFAYNAGATVVPFRPVGYQPIEIVLDNDDPGVTFTGTWSNGSASKYYENGTTLSGVIYKSATAVAVEDATARYAPTIVETGFYPVYGFALASSNRVKQLYRVSHSGGLSEVIVDHKEVGTGWVYLGEYYFEVGGDNYVEISNQSSESGAVIADAIRFGNGIGDIVRPGPNTVSGYPREEECARYWAHSELGNNAVGFTATDIWDSSSTDRKDNVSTASRWAREMNQVPAGGNQVDRWKRLYYEFHTNATGGGARGCIALVSISAPTTNQSAYATIMADEIDADMLLLESEFEHSWFDRSSSTYSSEYGAISTVGNNNEFDATIIELAFHDDPIDAELLRDPKVRTAMARSSVQGIIRFLNTLPGSAVPLSFPPDTPRSICVEDLGGGDVKISWVAPLSDGARGDPATGYVLYESSNGYGFGNPVVLGNVLTTTVSGVPVGETRYYRVAATNAGGESMPTETMVVRRPDAGTARVMIVNGFDSQSRFQNSTQDIGGVIERQIWRKSNSFDYTVQFADALDATTIGFVSCVNEAITNSQIFLSEYDMAMWILGAERSADATLTSQEQDKIEDFLNGGGALFISGSEIAFDLINQANGTSFMLNTLRAGFSGNDAGTEFVAPSSGGIFDGIGSFDFAVANDAPYAVYSPDILTLQAGAFAALDYVGGSGGIAAVQYDAGTYRTVLFGFGFEAISSPVARADVMDRVVAYLDGTIGPLTFDFDLDGDVDGTDFLLWNFCNTTGPGATYATGHICRERDGDGDADVDLADFAIFQRAYTGSQ